MRANPSSGRWNYGREISENFAESGDFHVTFGFFYTDGFTSPPKEGAQRIFSPEHPRTWVPKASTLTCRPPKPLRISSCKGYLAMGKNTNTSRKVHAYNKFKAIVGVCKDVRDTTPLKKQWRSALHFEIHWGGSNGPWTVVFLCDVYHKPFLFFDSATQHCIAFFTWVCSRPGFITLYSARCKVFITSLMNW